MKNLFILFCLIFLIFLTAIIKTSSKKIEEEVFILKENLIIFKEKYSLVLFEYTFLSNPSRLIKIMRINKNESYIHLKASDLKTLSKRQGEFFKKNSNKND